MQTITTQQGKRVALVSQYELRDARTSGAYVRAYCHIHGSDHQRSLSIRRVSGWGHCFNASCNATVLVAEWNPDMSARLLHSSATGSPFRLSSSFASTTTERPPLAMQPVLLYAPQPIPKWQQDEQYALLMQEEQFHDALSTSRRAHDYLAARGVPLQVARQSGVGYIAAERVAQWSTGEQRSLVRRWAARMLFPLYSPYGHGYIGRSLWQWRPGMNEQAHKALLEREAGPRRWIKTNPAGWFCTPFEQFASSIILVEGAFDRLALLAAGFAPTEVVALAGTALQIDWLPPQVKTIVLALDGDQGGQEATRRLADQLKQEGFSVKVCLPPQDRQGKDWNERWRLCGPQSVLPLRKTCSALRSA
jgi:hypothetical protein